MVAALSRRQAIRILTEPDNRWVKQVRAKYKFRSWLHPPRKSFISAYWKALSLVGPAIVGDMHSLIANGDGIHLWDDILRGLSLAAQV